MGCGASFAKKYEVASAEHSAVVTKAFPFQGYIAKTEERGITLDQLQRVYDFAKQHCKGWHDTAPAAYSKTAGKTLSVKFMNLYHLNSWLIMPATKERDCAMVELLSATPQIPVWFVSHWWGEPLKDFLLCVRRHAEVRGSKPEKDPFWVCAHANRQHSLGSEVVADPRETSFYKALQLAKGVLLVLDDKTPDGGPATPFTRIWCAFEEHVALTDERREVPLLLDVATSHRGKAEVITEGVSDADYEDEDGTLTEAMDCKIQRESAFPAEVLAKGFAVTLEAAQASVDSDRVHILNAIAERPDLDAAPLAEHPNYERINQKLRTVFAMAAWPMALRCGTVVSMKLPEVLAADAHTTELIFTFMGTNASDGDVQDLAGHLPQKLRKLDLDLSFCARFTDAGALSLGAALGGLAELSDLAVDLSESDVGDAGLASLAAGLRRARGLERLSLKFVAYDGSGVGDAGVHDLAEGLADLHLLKSLTLSFLRCGVSDAGAVDLGSLLAKLPLLSRVDINLGVCKSVGDDGTVALASALAGLPHLEDVSLDFQRCAVGDRGAIALVDSLESLGNLSRLGLQMAFTAIGDAGVKRLYLAFRGLEQGKCSTAYPTPSSVDLFRQWSAEAAGSSPE